MVAASRFFSRFSWDVVGFSASAVCAIHCLALPAILMASGITGDTLLHNHTIENVILVGSAIVGSIAIIPAYRKHHQSKLPLLIFFAGLVLIASGRFNISLIWESLLTTVGAITIATAHYLNWKACRPFHISRSSEKA